MAPAPLPLGTSGTPSTHLQTWQKVDGNDRLLFAFIDWLLPHLRLRTAKSSKRWDDFWKLFKSDGSLGWEEFERHLRWECKLNARKLFDILDENNTGKITSKAVLDVRRQYERLIDCRHSGLDDLRAILIRKYGNLMKAWRLLFDPMTRGRVSHTHFMKCCREVGFHGDLKTAWAELTDGHVNRVATIKDLDPEGHLMMLQFHDTLAKHHGTPRDGWFAILRQHSTYGRMSPEAFEEACNDFQFNKQFAKTLFSMLDVNNDKALTIDEWDFMELFGWDMANYTVRNGADSARSLGRASSSRESKAGPEMPTKKGAWQLMASGPDEPGPTKETATIEFQVILTKEEHREYLRRRREAELEKVAAARSPKSAVRSPMAPSKPKTAFASAPTPDPWG
mmetsp:Transcript_18578/g.39992  ORF Transcript_18578/g.39992 Transcript_18578/m.39992 type:complete len:394 (-) Transcript_18578:73-1254(-)